MNRLLFNLSLILLTIIAGAAGCSAQNQADKVLTSVKDSIETEFESFDSDLTKAAAGLTDLDLNGSQARSILIELLNKHPYIVDTCTVDTLGKVLNVEPAAYRNWEGADNSSLEQVIRLNRTLKPVISQSFRAIEGFEGAAFDCPVFAADKQIKGAVSAFFKPDVLLGSAILPEVKDTAFSIMVMQTDGRIIYDADSSQIGRNTFMDPMFASYPSLVSLGRQVCAKAAGSGGYEFRDDTGQTIKKSATWTTFSKYGTEWRVVLIQKAG